MCIFTNRGLSEDTQKDKWKVTAEVSSSTNHNQILQKKKKNTDKLENACEIHKKKITVTYNNNSNLEQQKIYH